jgi:CRP-like cAMP-binding protein
MVEARDGLALWLDRLLLRSTLGAPEQAAIMALPGLLETARPNRDFVRLGERVDRACLIVSGLAGRFSQTSDGQRQTTALHIPGDMANLHSLVLPQSASALRSLGDAVLYRVPHQEIRRLTATFPALAEAFWRDCTVDAAVLSQWALINGRLSARVRVAHLVAELCCRFAIGGCVDGMSLPWALTQIQLAGATGLTAVHVNRMLRQLREDGALEIRDKKLRVIGWERLCAVAHFNPRYLHLHKAL